MENAIAKILIVDDEPDILEILEYNLQKNGFATSKANNGHSALRYLDNNIPDLILLDIMLPGLDGVEVCRQIRLNKKLEKTIVVFLTARNEEFTQIAALDIGGDDFISKPIKIGVLLSRIKALLRRSDKNEALLKQAPIIEIGEIRIDIEKFIVEKSKIPIEFPKKEFQLLLLLISKPGKVFTRDEIYRKIWGNDVFVGNRTIDVHIRKIREKIGDDLVKTIKGIGYKLEI